MNKWKIVLSIVLWIVYWVLYPLLVISIISIWYTTTNDTSWKRVTCIFDNICFKKNVEIPFWNTYVNAFADSQKLLKERWLTISDEYARFWNSNNMEFIYKKRWEFDVIVNLEKHTVTIGEKDDNF